MPTNLKDFCFALRDCAQKLEEELMININDSNNMVVSGLGSEIKMALDRAKDIHYKEILKFMRDILINIRQIIYHEEQIRSLSKKEKMSDEDIKKYSYVQRQVTRFDNKVVMRRERRRGVSNMSAASLDAWEKYMDENKKEEPNLATSLPCLVDAVPTVKKDGRRIGLITAETSNIFEGVEQNSSLDSINENGVHNFDGCSDRLCEIAESDDENDTEKEIDGKCEEECVGKDAKELRSCESQVIGDELRPDTGGEDEVRSSFVGSDEDNIEIEDAIDKEQYPIYNLVKSLSEEHLLEPADTKPRIVHVVYKNQNQEV